MRKVYEVAPHVIQVVFIDGDGRHRRRPREAEGGRSRWQTDGSAEPMYPTVASALALIEDHNVEHGMPSVLEMHDVRAAMEGREAVGSDPVVLAHDTLMGLGWRVSGR